VTDNDPLPTTHRVALTVTVEFKGDYYSPDEMADVATGWIDAGLEDRDDVVGWIITSPAEPTEESLT